MKRLLLAVAALLVSSVSFATPYARLVGSDGHVHQSAAVLIDPSGHQTNAGVTDVAILYHNTADGSIIPAKWRTVLPPENWAILELGGGGSAHVTNGRLSGDALIHVGTSVNLAPQIGALVLKGVGASSPAWAQAVKAAMLNTGNNGVRLGAGFAANAVQDGVCQSAKEMFPGQGVLDITKRAARIAVGYSWAW